MPIRSDRLQSMPFGLVVVADRKMSDVVWYVKMSVCRVRWVSLIKEPVRKDEWKAAGEMTPL